MASEKKNFKGITSGNLVDDENQFAGPDEEVTASKRILQPSNV